MSDPFALLARRACDEFRAAMIATDRSARAAHRAAAARYVMLIQEQEARLASA